MRRCAAGDSEGGAEHDRETTVDRGVHGDAAYQVRRPRRRLLGHGGDHDGAGGEVRGFRRRRRSREHRHRAGRG